MVWFPFSAITRTSSLLARLVAHLDRELNTQRPGWISRLPTPMCHRQDILPVTWPDTTVVYTRPLRHALQRRPCRSAAARRAGGSRGVRAGVPRRLRASVGRRFPYIEQQGARRRGVAGGFHECVAQRGRVRCLGGGPDDLADQYRPQQGDRRAALVQV